MLDRSTVATLTRLWPTEYTLQTPLELKVYRKSESGLVTILSNLPRETGGRWFNESCRGMLTLF